MHFIPFGATLTNLFVKDKNGKDVDVVLGYNDLSDPLAQCTMRFQDCTGEASYTIDDELYLTERNDRDNTLHSDSNNWSFRDWEVSHFTKDSTFSILDASNSSKGMLGDVHAPVTYSVKGSTWKISMEATSSEAKTPLMLTQRTYFNLDAYKNPDTGKIWKHTLHMPYTQKYLVADDSAVPTGETAVAELSSINDFASEPDLQLGHASDDPAFPENCGAGCACEGYNGYWLIVDAPKDAVVMSLASPFSGISADLKTNQLGIVLYTCNWFDGSQSLKRTQGLEGKTTVDRSSCVAIQAHDHVNEINEPQWGRKEAQLTGPGETYKWENHRVELRKLEPGPLALATIEAVAEAALDLAATESKDLVMVSESIADGVAHENDSEWVHDRYDDNNDCTMTTASNPSDGVLTFRRQSPRPNHAPCARPFPGSELFQRIGPVTRLQLRYDRAGRSEGTAYVTYELKEDASEAVKQFDGANANGQPIRLTMLGGRGDRSRNPFDSAVMPGRPLSERISAPGRARSHSPSGRYSQEDAARKGIDRYIPGGRSRTPPPARRRGGANTGRRPGARRERGPQDDTRGGRSAPRGKRTQEELDADMADYFGGGEPAPEANGNAAEAPAAAPAPAAAATDDIDMIE
ncbi:uncharacterized protein J7T54_008218 [Emericellopsis cladophorae]|uniref:RRM domain-containing protein n=1 Tax=Emericellopsis cladophorae TaxID=2686198 RepID=A0A9Q0BCI8_9HYPO|nr:uncharacterized protein J7T54_008218 [Emericellopsis cladophorae]KAI6779600.1 hypothetical protein J7T54_008218 [Emericellopsis cladophorae]